MTTRKSEGKKQHLRCKDKDGCTVLRRTGYIYSEFTNKGRRSIHAAQGGIIKCYRWVGCIMVNGKRHRFRSTSLANVQAWMNDMIERYPYYYAPNQKGKPHD